MSLPQNKSAQAAQHLKEQILAGIYEKSLPSERLLAEQLLISRNCVRDALAILTREGALSPPAQSRRREILISKKSRKKEQPTRCVILSPNAEHSITEQLFGQLARLRGILAKSNILVEVHSSPAFRSKHPADLLVELTASLPNTIWVLHLCPEKIQAWFNQSDLSCIVFGSPFLGSSLANVDSDHAATARHAAGKLLQLGHRHIGLILPRTELAGAQLAEQGFSQALAQSPHQATPLVLRHDFNIPRLTDTLNKVYSKEGAPTAFIIQNSHHFLTVYSHLLSIKQSIPADVSLISMTYTSSFDRLTPMPTHYTTGNKFIRSLASSIIHCSAAKKTNTTLLPDFEEGATIDRCF